MQRVDLEHTGLDETKKLIIGFLETLHKDRFLTEKSLLPYVNTIFEQDVEDRVFSLKKVAERMKHWNDIAKTSEITIHDLISERNKAFAHYTVEATTAPDAVFPESTINIGNKTFSITLLSLFTIKNGRIAKMTTFMDNVRNALAIPATDRTSYLDLPLAYEEMSRTEIQASYAEMGEAGSLKYKVHHFLQDMLSNKASSFDALKYVSPDFECESLSGRRGPMGIKTLIHRLRQWTDLCPMDSFVVQEMVCEDDQVAVQFTFSGRMMEGAKYPGTDCDVGGKTCIIPGLALFDFEGDKIIREVARIESPRTALGVPNPKYGIRPQVVETETNQGKTAPMVHRKHPTHTIEELAAEAGLPLHH